MTNVRYVSKENSAIFFETPSNFESAGFTAKPLDKETGLYNFPQRYYDSRNVKWLTLDPIGPALMIHKAGAVTSLNWYNYCGNNPIMYNDPEGLSKQTGKNNMTDDAEQRYENSRTRIDHAGDLSDVNKKKNNAQTLQTSRNIETREKSRSDAGTKASNNRNITRNTNELNKYSANSLIKMANPGATMFDQDKFANTMYKGQELTSDWSDQACAITCIINIISEIYTLETGLRMTRGMADEAIVAGINGGSLYGLGSNGVKGDPMNAFNQMAASAGLKGTFSYVKGKGSTHIIVWVDGPYPTGHYINGWEGTTAVFDVFPATMRDRSEFTVKLDFKAYYNVP